MAKDLAKHHMGKSECEQFYRNRKQMTEIVNIVENRVMLPKSYENNKGFLMEL